MFFTVAHRGRVKRLRVICDSPRMVRLGIGGMVLWPRVCFAMPAEFVPATLFKHEMTHVYQILRERHPLVYYLKYFWYSIRYGYLKNPYEVEAFKCQHQPLTPTEDALLCILNARYRSYRKGSLLASRPATQPSN